jgi:glyoxalase family protein
MNLQGLHHITMITGDARANVDFYAGVLGLRLVKKTVNFDSPDAYHLYFGDETGSPGSILTWFEFPGAAPGRPGLGMVHTLRLGVPSEAALDFWADRLGTERADTLRFADPDGLALELVVAEGDQRAEHPDIPAEFAVNGIAGARAYSAYAGVEEKVLTDILGFTYEGDGEYRLDGFEWAYDRAPGDGRQGAGSVHHIAWASRDEDHLAWQERIGDAGGYVTDVRDRDYFKSIYFQEPRGVLFEIATLSPGFAVDEDPAHLGEALRLPRQHEHLREQLERTLTPIENPHARQVA